MKNETPARVLVVGRSPSVLVTTVELLRGKGHRADATNQFDQVLDDYDVSDLDVVVFGGMVPADTKRHLGDEITKRNPGVTFVQGLVGIPGVIAAQVDAVTSDVSAGGAEIGYHPEDRTVRVALPDATRVTIEAWWMTSWRPPEPASTSMQVFDGELGAGSHDIVLPTGSRPKAPSRRSPPAPRCASSRSARCPPPSCGWCRNRPPTSGFPLSRPSPPTATTLNEGADQLTATTILPAARPSSMAWWALTISSKPKTRAGLAWYRPVSALVIISCSGMSARGNSPVPSTNALP